MQNPLERRQAVASAEGLGVNWRARAVRLLRALFTLHGAAPRSLAVQIGVAGSLLTALVAVALYITMVHSATEELTRTIGEGELQLAHTAAARLDAALFERVRHIVSLSDNNPAIQATASNADLRRELDRIQHTYPQYVWLGIADPSGRVRASTGQLLEGQSVSSRPWFVRGLSSVNVVDLHAAQLLDPLLRGEPGATPLRLVDVAAPLRDVHGHVWGVLGAHLDSRWFGSELTRALDVPRAGQAQTLLIDLYDADGDHVIDPSEPERLDFDAAARVSLRDRQRGVFTLHYRGTDWLAGFAHMAGDESGLRLPWTVVVAQPRAAIIASERVFLAPSLLVTLIAFALTALASILVASRLGAPIAELAQATRALSRGERDSLPNVRGGSAELQDLASSFAYLVSELKHEQREIEQLNMKLAARLDFLADNSPGMVFQMARGTDGRPHFNYVSLHCERVFGVNREALMNNTSLIFPVVHEADRAAVGRLHRDAFVHGRSFSTEYRARNAAGEDMWLLIEAQHRLDEGREVWDGLALDITARKVSEAALAEALARAEAATSAKSRLVASVSHELRTPLNAIVGFSDLLAEEDLPSKAQAQVKLVQDSAHGLLQLINDVLDVSKNDENAITLNEGVFRPGDVFETVTAIMTQAARDKGLDLQLDSDVLLPEQAWGDPQRLRQVCLNLIANAIKFTLEGTVTMTVRWKASSRRLTVTVRDTGVGLPAHEVTRLFQPFSQAESTVARGFTGTGLGLYLSKRIIDRLQGTISLHSRQGTGTEVVFEIPLAAVPVRAGTTAANAASRPAQASAEPAFPAPPGLQGKAPLSGPAPGACHILVADDLSANRLLMAALLQADGHTVELVEDGAEALAAAKRSRFDLILLDVQMPVMDGLAAARAIRDLPSPHGQVPIVAMSANAFTEDIAASLLAGMNEHLSKPVIRGELRECIARLALPASAGGV